MHQSNQEPLVHIQNKSINRYIVQLTLSILIAHQCIVHSKAVGLYYQTAVMPAGACRAHLAWCSHPVPEDLGVQPRKEHQAYDPVCVAQGAAPQQQVGHVQGVPAAICLHHCPFKDVQPAVIANHCRIMRRKAFDYCYCYHLLLVCLLLLLSALLTGTTRVKCDRCTCKHRGT